MMMMMKILMQSLIQSWRSNLSPCRHSGKACQCPRRHSNWTEHCKEPIIWIKLPKDQVSFV